MLLAIGEAKWAEPLGAGHLARLRRVRELLARAGHPGAETARLFLFTGTEPGAGLGPAAGEDVSVFRLADLYG